MDKEFKNQILRSVQRSLIGEVTPQMRFIGVEISEKKIHIIVWHDGTMSKKNKEDFDGGAITQVVADFAWPERGDPDVSFEFIRCDFPRKIDFEGTLVYGRKESS